MHLYSDHLVLAQDPKAGNDAHPLLDWFFQSRDFQIALPQVNLACIILLETPFTDVLLSSYCALVQAVGF